MTNTFENQTDVVPEAFHTHDEELRDFDFSRPEAIAKAGGATVELLHEHYGDTIDGAQAVRATE
jgi:hypothetical protein